MRALMKWSALIGAGIAISYILMYFLGAYFGVTLYILFFILLCISPVIFLFIAAKFKKRQLAIFIAQIFASWVIFFSFIVITVTFFPLLGSNIVKGMTKEKILSIEPGMSKDDVIATLGKSVEIVEFKYENGYRFVYATPGIYGMGFEFDIRFINDKLDGIYIERNDFGVYSCYKQKCPNLYNPEALDELISYSSKSLLPRFLKVN